jgi:hypothetical protein
MPRNNFDDVLHVPDRPELPEGKTGQEGEEELPGPRAAGPVSDGDTMEWIYVWIIQNGPEGRAAAAYGESEHGTSFTGRWDIETEMAHDSNDFTPDRPALATAMALVTSPDGTKEIDWWSEAITMAAAKAGPAA